MSDKIEAEQEEVVVDEAVEEVTDESVEQDTESSDDAESPELEDWQLTDEEDSSDVQDDNADVPVGKVIKMKERLRGKIDKRDEENTQLKERIATLEANTTTTSTELPPRPKAIDYDTDDLHEEALEEWRDKKADIRAAGRDASRNEATTTKQEQEKIAKDVDSHYDRSAELVTKSGISAEHFKEADESVRQAVETILPNRGDGVTDYIISVLGEGSEKVIYFLGRNKAAKAEFQSLLAEDKTGSKALVYLGQQKERLNNPKRKITGAPKPANNAKGDVVPSQSGAALKKKYDEAHKKGNLQAAYDFKKQAKAAKVDVSSW